MQTGVLNPQALTPQALAAALGLPRPTDEQAAVIAAPARSALVVADVSNIGGSSALRRIDLDPGIIPTTSADTALKLSDPGSRTGACRAAC